ncbi:Gfo/Idh/MocA family oxidoreductase [Brevundimonas intermedia]|uniref:Gfo/Idh/MocA family oxidoreductase n=1 Tax=Brevundimonas intermedia TaxID=74315 RepID=A0A4Y9S136_9CAUL|nr:Gfo/Idh/MocA family oxidoreductase [Brevundimonas intermedia]TFW14201.1 Gfo/Idh/MocA family oxidoreductase [Brevundimonas intermedia]
MTDIFLERLQSSALRRPRVGFLGVGWIGRNRMQAMLAGGQIEAAAIADPDTEMAREALRLAPNAAVCADLDQLLAQGLDGLVIATPSAMHAEQTVRALDAGVAVFCQKPLGRDAVETRGAIAAAKCADRLLAVDLSYRHTAAAQALRGLLRAGRLGRIRAVDLTFHNAYGPDKPWFYDPALSGGGCVMDLGVHLIDLCLWLLDDDIAEVDAHLSRDGLAVAGRTEAEDYAVATLVLKSGAIVRLACSWRLPAGQDAVIEAAFYGEGAGAAMRNVGGSFYDFEAVAFEGVKSSALVRPPDEWGGRAALAWSDALARGGRYDPAVESMTDVAAALDRIYASAKSLVES